MIDSFRGEYRFLSNFGPGQIELGKEVYLTSEHLYQALKTLDPKEQKFVRIAPTPGEAKRRGKKITLREDWDEVKDDIMRMVLDLKFSQNPDLRRKLLATGDQELIESNIWGDVYWGVCFGSGQNKLGLLLQETRANAALPPMSESEQRDFFASLPTGVTDTMSDPDNKEK